MKYVPASVRSTAFNCPHCDVLTTHRWHRVMALEFNNKDVLPMIYRDADIGAFLEGVKDDAQWARLNKLLTRAQDGYVFISHVRDDAYVNQLMNLNASLCYSCDKVSIWLEDRLLYPEKSEGPPANNDTPPEILVDYNEASQILHQSPRGAAALIRLCIQKLCKHLGQPGENLNADIGALVAQGLDVRVQRALDAVRVIGNNAVHPGQIDLRDDRATAETLFRIFNLIVEKLISEPSMVDELYAQLPATVLAQIERRDKPKS